MKTFKSLKIKPFSVKKKKDQLSKQWNKFKNDLFCVNVIFYILCKEWMKDGSVCLTAYSTSEDGVYIDIIKKWVSKNKVWHVSHTHTH